MGGIYDTGIGVKDPILAKKRERFPRKIEQSFGKGRVDE